MTQQNFGKLASLSIVTLLGWNLVTPQNAQAIIYDVDFSVNSFTATGTIETSGIGDLANGDFTFIDWEVFLDDGSGGIPEATLTPADTATAFSTAISGNLDVGDVVATLTTLSFSNINIDGAGNEAFGVTNSTFDNSLCFGSCTEGALAQTQIRISNVDRIDDTGASGTNFAVFNAAPASVPWEFSPTLGLLSVGGMIGISRLRKSLNSHKLNQ